LKEVFLFELRYRARHFSTYLFFALLFLLGFLFMGTEAMESIAGNGRVKYNAPFLILNIGNVIGLFGGLIVSAVVGTAVYRDFEANAHELFFTTRLSRGAYFFGRFLGAFAVVCLIFQGIPLGLFAGTVVHWPDADRYGPFRPDVYLFLTWVLLVPNLLLTGSLFFVLGALTRNLLAIYVQGLVLFALYLISLVVIGRVENLFLLSLLDPFGLVPLNFATQEWTQYQRNTELPALAGKLLTNRLFWLGVSAVALVVGYRLFAFAKHALSFPALRLRRRHATDARDAAPAFAPGNAPPPAPRGPAFLLAAYRRLTRHYFREIVFSVPFVIVTLVGVTLFLVTALNEEKVLDTPVLPVTRVMLTSVAGSLTFIALVLVTFYAGELTWRERVVGADQLTDSLPLPNALAPVAKASAVFLMVLVLSLALVVSGIAIQAVHGYFDFEPGLYAAYFAVDVLPGLLHILLTAMFVHAVVNQKFVGNVATVGLVLSSLVFYLLKWERHLLVFVSAPDVTYSDMNGFGPYLETSLWYGVYWTGITLALFLVGLRVWVRGPAEKLSARWRSGGFGRVGSALLAVALLAVAVSGGYVYYNTDILNRYRSAKLMQDWQADYERRFKADWEKKPMPRVTRVSLDVDLRPEKRQYTVTGTYRLKNRTAVPLSEIALLTDPDLTARKLEFSVPATPGVHHRETGFRTFRFATPLRPGEEIGLSFVLAMENRGFRNADLETSIAENGTFLTLPGPRVGYQPDLEISGENDREERGLPPRPDANLVTDKASLQNPYLGNDADRIAFEAVVRTAPDQIALAPGYLQREWRENGRHCFAYKMDRPIFNFYSVLSARYRVAKDTWTAPDGGKVALEIYYHPAHGRNIPRMFDGMKSALTYCAENFGPYQYRQLRIAEFPVYRSFAQSFPNTIPYSEGLGFIARVKTEKDAEGVDYPFYITAHETAHQWWGHQVVGADVEGATLLSESLAEYTALQVLEGRYGYGQTSRMLYHNIRAYLKGRGEERREERPLVSVGNQPYIHYNKGALAFYGLAWRVGEKNVNNALGAFLRATKDRPAPYPTAPELLNYLRNDLEPVDQLYVTDVFEKITLWDCRVTEARAERRKNGKWRVRAKVYVAKVYADGAGRETPAPAGDDYDFSVASRSGGRKSHVYVTRRLTSAALAAGNGYADVTIDVDAEPARVSISPYYSRIERDHSDNFRDVDTR
jgi:ABC-2 type transport system permease protein